MQRSTNLQRLALLSRKAGHEPGSSFPHYELLVLSTDNPRPATDPRYGENDPTGWVSPLKVGPYRMPLWINPIYDLRIMQNNPKWWNKQNESSWERVKAAFKRDWDQTKHDVGGKQPDTSQGIGDTVKQASGKEAIPPRGMPNYEQTEDAYRFGYGARQQYAERYPQWDSSLEEQLSSDWKDTYAGIQWESYRTAVQRGWDYQDKQGLSKAA